MQVVGKLVRHMTLADRQDFLDDLLHHVASNKQDAAVRLLFKKWKATQALLSKCMQ